MRATEPPGGGDPPRRDGIPSMHPCLVTPGLLIGTLIMNKTPASTAFMSPWQREANHPEAEVPGVVGSATQDASQGPSSVCLSILPSTEPALSYS